MHAAQPKAKFSLISFRNSKKYLAKIAQASSQNGYILFLLLMGGWCILSISPCQPLHAVGYTFACPNIVCLIAVPNFNQTPKQGYPSQLEKISKRKRTRSLSEYIPIYRSSLQCDVCIPSHLVTISVAKGRASHLWKNFRPFWKMSWIYCMHKHCFCACYRCKICASLRKLFAPLCVQSWWRVCWWLLPCDVCQLCHAAQSFHNHIFQV